LDLSERIDKVGTGRLRNTVRPPDDRELARQRIAATETVDLPAVGGTEDSEQHATALLAIHWQVLLAQKDRLARPAAHDHAAQLSGVAHSAALSWAASGPLFLRRRQ